MTYKIFARPKSNVVTLAVPPEAAPLPDDLFALTATDKRIWAVCECGSLSSHPPTDRGTSNLIAWQDRHRTCAPNTDTRETP